MEVIKQWALTVCMACIALGILGQFVNVKTNFSVIKLVITLYILITAFAPLNITGDVNLDLQEYINEDEINLNSEEYVLDMAKNSLRQKILNEYAINDILVKDIDVKLNSEDYLAIELVEIYTLPQTDVQKATEYAQSALEQQVQIKIISEE